MTMENRTNIIDCTIRDGGLVNNWDFSVEFVQDLYHGLNEAGVEYMEIGYKNSPKLLKASEPNPWRFLDDQFLKEVIPEKKTLNYLLLLILAVLIQMMFYHANRVY